MLVESKIQVRYPDCDPMGIVHHAVYPLWYEIGRMDYFSAIGYPYLAMQQDGINPPMVNMNLSYAAPIRFPGQVTIRTTCTLCQKKKLELRYAAYQEGRPAPYAAGTSFHIWTGPDLHSLDMSSKPDIYQKLLGGVERPGVLILPKYHTAGMGSAEPDSRQKELLLQTIHFWRDRLPNAAVYLYAIPSASLCFLPPDVTVLAPAAAACSFPRILRTAFDASGLDLLWVSDAASPRQLSTWQQLLERKRCHCEDACILGCQEPALFGLYRSSCINNLHTAALDDAQFRRYLTTLCTTTVPLPTAEP